MRGTVAKRLRKFVKEDTPDAIPIEYTTIVRGQQFKMLRGKKPNETRVLQVGCLRKHYKQLKHIWKAVS